MYIFGITISGTGRVEALASVCIQAGFPLPESRKILREISGYAQADIFLRSAPSGAWLEPVGYVESAHLPLEWVERIQSVELDSEARARTESVLQILHQFTPAEPLSTWQAACLLICCQAFQTLPMDQLYLAAIPVTDGDAAATMIARERRLPATLSTDANCTPLCTALLAETADFNPARMVISQTFNGFADASIRDRVTLLTAEPVSDRPSNGVFLIETNIDDMSPQILADVCVHLLEAGALDVYQTTVFMKKNRIGVRLSVSAKEADLDRIAGMILAETSTTGLQTRLLEHRFKAHVEVSNVETRYGMIRIKLKKVDGRVVQVSPEYDHCAALARQHNVPLLQVYQAALAASRALD